MLSTDSAQSLIEPSDASEGTPATYHNYRVDCSTVLTQREGGGGVFSSAKKGTFEQRRLTIISEISGFIPIWITGMPKHRMAFPTVLFYIRHAEYVETLRLLQYVYNFSTITCTHRTYLKNLISRTRCCFA